MHNCKTQLRQMRDLVEDAWSTNLRKTIEAARLSERVSKLENQLHSDWLDEATLTQEAEKHLTQKIRAIQAPADLGPMQRKWFLKGTDAAATVAEGL